MGQLEPSISAGLAHARTWLFVPGDRPDRFAKAAESGADVVIVDLEDAVDGASKAAARVAVVESLLGGWRPVVRVSAAGTTDFDLDVEVLASIDARPAAVMLAKAENPGDVTRLHRALGVPVVPIVESARGLLSAPVIASARGVIRVAFGAIDFALDIAADNAVDVLAYARSSLVVACRAAGVSAPLDSPSLALRDMDVVVRDALEAKRFGMGGKLCIHPVQVPVVARAFRPTDEELVWARNLLAAAHDDGASVHDGLMVDRPVLERARRVLAQFQDSDGLVAREEPAS